VAFQTSENKTKKEKKRQKTAILCKRRETNTEGAQLAVTFRTGPQIPFERGGKRARTRLASIENRLQKRGYRRGEREDGAMIVLGFQRGHLCSRRETAPSVLWNGKKKKRTQPAAGFNRWGRNEHSYVHLQEWGLFSFWGVKAPLSAENRILKEKRGLKREGKNEGSTLSGEEAKSYSPGKAVAEVGVCYSGEKDFPRRKRKDGNGGQVRRVYAQQVDLAEGKLKGDYRTYPLRKILPSGGNKTL